MNEISEFLEEENRIIKELYQNASKAYFDAIVSGKKEDYEDYTKKDIKFKEHFNNKENFEKIKNFLKTAEDLIEKRQLTILYNDYLSCQGDKKLIEEISVRASEIEQKFNTFRAKIGEEEVTDNKIKEILKKDTNSEKLKEVWEANKKQGEIVEKDLIELIKLRNTLAKSLGFENYYAMALELAEQKEEEIEKIFDELKEKTEKAFRGLKDEMDDFLSKRCGIKKEDLRPWHYQDLFFHEGPEIYDVNLDEIYKKDILQIAKDFYGRLGLDTEDVLKTSDLYEKPGKYQHACCINLDRSGDVRIVENIKNNEYWMSTTLHELGHAVYDKGCDPALPSLLRENAHTFVTEAIALLFERNSSNLSFIKKYGNFTGQNNEEFGEYCRKQLRLKELAFMKWSQVMFHFERELYKNPDQDLNKLWWEFVKKYQLIDFSRDKPDWASKIHLTSSPAYYHNYLLGKILASQLNNHIAKIILKQGVKNAHYSDKKVGDFLKEKIFFPGRRYRWDELIERALGEPLNPRYFIEEFTN